MPRLPEYDRNTVVEKAMAVFWKRGYGQTSVTDLVDATGLKPGSLYAAFGSKKGVFLEAIDFYNRDLLGRIRAACGGDSAVLDQVRLLLEGIVDEAMESGERRGCLMVNALLELSQHDEDIADRLGEHSEKVRQAFAEILDHAKTQGEIAGDKDTRALSAFLMNNIWGMRVMCKNRPNRASLDAIVDGVMAGLKY